MSRLSPSSQAAALVPTALVPTAPVPTAPVATTPVPTALTPTTRAPTTLLLALVVTLVGAPGAAAADSPSGRAPAPALVPSGSASPSASNSALNSASNSTSDSTLTAFRPTPVPPMGRAEPGRRYRFGLLGGAAGITRDTPHYFGVFEAGFLGERFGGFAQAHGGGGSAHASVLLEGGAGVVLVERGRLDVVAHAGPGLYLEVNSTGTRRRTGVLAGGLSVRVPAGSLTLAAGASAWRGRYSGQDFSEPAPVRGFRLGLGVGWGWRS